MAPKNTPMARFTPTRTANPGRSSERPARWRAAAPDAGGAVRRCAAKHSPPATTKAAASAVPSCRVPAGAEDADQGRAGQVGQLVGQRFQRERGGQRRGSLVAQQRRPAGRGQRAKLGDGGAGQYPARRHQPVRGAGGDQGQQRGHRRGVGQQRGRQHPGLAEAVDQPGQLRAGHCLGDGEPAGHQPGRGIGAGPGVHQPDDAQAGHRDADAADGGGQEEGGGAGRAQQGAVGRR